MKNLLLTIWEHLRSSFWFLPALMAICAIALAMASVAVDEAVSDRWMQWLGWAYTGGADGAALMLGTVAGSMITIAGTVFSMTLVTLSLASTQLGPRLLRNFMRDTTNQVVLGTFVATFVYCLVVLSSIRRAVDAAFVPHLSVTIGVLLAIVSLGVLIFFIHHVSMSIQADAVVARVGRELIGLIDRLYPERAAGAGPGAAAARALAALPEAFAREAFPVAAWRDGYLQLADADALARLATEKDIVLRVERRIGHYLVKGSTLALAWPADRIADSVADDIHAAFAIGDQRTSIHDVAYGVHQLVEVAVRALSPGINDPFTAIACVDRLGSALSHLAQRDMPSGDRFDETGCLRLVVPLATFADVADSGFNQIRQHAHGSAAVTLRLLETIAAIAGATHRADDRTTLRRHAEMIARGAKIALPEEADRDAVDQRLQRLTQLLAEPADAPLAPG